MQDQMLAISAQLVRRPQPHSTTHREKTVLKTKMERVAKANKKSLTLLVKPASPTPSNTAWVNRFTEIYRGE